MIRNLCYHQHGGSGYCFTRADVLEMSLGEIESHVEWLVEQRRRETRALKGQPSSLE